MPVPPDPARLRQLAAGLADIRQHREAGRIDQAVNLVAAMVRAEPTHVPALRTMASLAMQTGTPQIAIGCLGRATGLSPRAPEVFADYGEALLAGARPADAETAFKQAIALRANDGASYRGLAQAQLDQGKREAALKSFRKTLSLIPYDKYAAHMAAALSGEATASATSYVPELFDKYSETFDEHLTGTLAYSVPTAIHDMIAPFATKRPLQSLLDLGCGTGLVGAALHDLIADMDGIDIATQMVRKAEHRGIYRKLCSGDFVATMQGNPDFAGPYDVVAAGDVFIYVGHLESAFAAIRAAIAPDGLFVFSAERSESDDVAIRSSGRYAHSASYIETLSTRCGFTVIEQRDIAIRQERNLPIKGYLYLLTPQ